jgi:hypothetical protein
VRIGTAIYLLLAIPGLIFGFLLKVDELGFPCDSSGGLWSGPDTWQPPTSGVACEAIDFTPLYWLAPAIALAIIAVGIAAARYSTSH